MRLFVAFSTFCLAVVLASCSQRQIDLRQLPSESPNGASHSSPGPKLSPHTRFTLLYSFDGQIGAHPAASLIEFRGLLFGTAQTGGGCCGSVFSVDPNSDVSKLVYGFKHQPDGAYPRAGLIAVKGRLYGTTTAGGEHGHHGAVFEVDPATGAERALHSFNGTDGSFPESGLIEANGLLYGTTTNGGANNVGTVFDVDPASGAEHVLHSFRGADGAHPKAGLLALNGLLYGTTYEGGDCCGTIFELNPTTKTERVVFKFNGGAGGGFPLAGLIAVNGRLYGTTEQGSNAGAAFGNVFEFDPSSGSERSIHSFDANDGSRPRGGLTLMGGKLYGTTYRGGTSQACQGQYSGCGTVFEVSLDGAERVLVTFSGGNGESPEAGLVALNGRLYGTTATGGAGAGTVFEVLP